MYVVCFSNYIINTTRYNSNHQRFLNIVNLSILIVDKTLITVSMVDDGILHFLPWLN